MMNKVNSVVSKGIFSDQNGQDTLEYVAMGLIAILLGALILGILRPLVSEKTQLIADSWPQ